MAEDKPQRIAKVLARAGLCSRRVAERWIAEGRVAVDGTVLTSPAVTVTPANKVTVNGEPVQAAAAAQLWRYHKPTGLVTTERDPQGRTTVFEKLPPELPRVMSIGRLDLNSEGLLLLTNDGELKRKLEHPSTGWVRRYRVRLHGRVTPEALERLAKGVTVDGMRYKPIRATLDSQRSANAWITMALSEGKYREIRIVCTHLGWTVNRLIRVSYGPFQLGNLEAGAVEKVPTQVLAEQLGESAGKQKPKRHAHRRR